MTLPPTPDYAIETTYEVGQRVFYPYLYEGEDVWFSADALPPEVFDADGAPGFLVHRDRWYFFAVNMDLPGEREVIDIASAEYQAFQGAVWVSSRCSVAMS